MLEKEIEKAKVLVEALPFIKGFNGQTILVKYGGSLMVNPVLQERFAKDVVLLKYIGLNPIVVHGGGKEISKWLKKVGKESVFIDGLRVTDSETMELTEMVLSGKVNSQIITLINKQGGKAVGLSGKSANLFVAEKVKSQKDKDLGFVGDIQNVDCALLDTLASKGYIPVISSVGADSEGNSLNLNADHVASELAIAIKAKKLIFLTDVNGILKGGELLTQLKLSAARNLLSDPEITGGMVPKLTCAVEAVEKGVGSVHMINGAIEHAVLLELFTKSGIGTMISGE